MNSIRWFLFASCCFFFSACTLYSSQVFFCIPASQASITPHATEKNAYILTLETVDPSVIYVDIKSSDAKTFGRVSVAEFIDIYSSDSALIEFPIDITFCLAASGQAPALQHTMAAYMPRYDTQKNTLTWKLEPGKDQGIELGAFGQSVVCLSLNGKRTSALLKRATTYSP